MSTRRLPVVPIADAVYTASASDRFRGIVVNHPPQRPNGGPTAADLTAAVGDLQTAFAGFVEGQNRLLGGIVAQVDGLGASAEEHSRMIAALRVGGGGDGSAAPVRTSGGPAINAAAAGTFRKFLMGGAHAFEGPYAAMRTDSLPDGGFAVPDDVRTEIDRLIRDVSPFRGLAEVISTTTGTHKRHKWISAAATGWVGETQTRPKTDMSKLTELAFPVHEQYAMPAATAQLIADSRVGMAEQIANEIRLAFGEQEGVAFVTGDGVGQPRGVLSYDTAPVASWEWGKLGYVATADAAGFIASTATAGPTDCLVNMVTALRRAYHPGAVWQMNAETAGIVQKFRDSEGRLIWAQSLVAGQPSLLLGFPVVINNDFPNVGAGEFPIAFGDFRQGYLIVDRQNISILPDPFTEKPFVLFYTTRRVGGGVQNFDAIRLLKVAAS